jgi:tryptophan 2,3-dioxygenase
MSEPSSAALNYSHYLRIDDLLACQVPRSDEHDELLFIVIHQVYELWFKQLLHELGRLHAVLAAGDIAATMACLGRVLAILKTVVAQIDVLETLTPRGFLSFRDRLDSASGFQSAQFRQIEAVLGRRDPSMLEPYGEDSAEHARIAAAMAGPDILDALLAFLGVRGWAVCDRADEAGVEGLLLDVHRADPVATMVCEKLVDLDEGIQEWRYRHVKMVERTIGGRLGTGGSAGAAYLRSTLFKPVFPALWAIRSRL